MTIMVDTKPLQVLVLEDRPSDAELILHDLKRAGYNFLSKRVDTKADYLRGIDEIPDIILADYSLPQFTAMEALHLLQERGLDIPFIVVTGTISEEAAVETMKHGAADYLLKDRLGRLAQAVERASNKNACAMKNASPNRPCASPKINSPRPSASPPTPSPSPASPTVAISRSTTALAG